MTYAPNPARSRNPAAVRARVIAALSAMIVRDGLSSVGVNALARAAGCDKVLIYRYFGDLEGVYQEFAEGHDFWWTVDELVRDIDPERMSRTRAMQVLMRRHAEAIRKRPTTLAILASELTERSALVVALEEVRERRTLELIAWIGQRFEWPPTLDLPAISMLHRRRGELSGGARPRREGDERRADRDGGRLGADLRGHGHADCGGLAAGLTRFFEMMSPIGDEGARNHVE